ncbi:uncharacterized protein LOC123316840 isoform X2 [Coccinella septempunctata]|uniref:uncharacterized protein LOC123316840 isoform X2 n=1 Tax=Coccinella septempunctata TaxID=41139 RepID=UPI001D07A1D7|nr:uncharacterized protein LOC123316840 isoform X2 [Coccinella septempunctata]
MPKKARSSHRKKDAQMRKLKKKLKQMEEQIRKIQSSESSESDHKYSKEESSDSDTHLLVEDERLHLIDLNIRVKNRRCLVENEGRLHLLVLSPYTVVPSV